MLSIVETAASVDGSVIGLWAAGEAEDVFVLYHVPTGESWPRLRDDEVSITPSAREKWYSRYALLKANHPDLPLPNYFVPPIPDEWTKRE